MTNEQKIKQLVELTKELGKTIRFSEKEFSVAECFQKIKSNKEIVKMSNNIVSLLRLDVPVIYRNGDNLSSENRILVQKGDNKIIFYCNVDPFPYKGQPDGSPLQKKTLERIRREVKNANEGLKNRINFLSEEYSDEGKYEFGDGLDDDGFFDDEIMPEQEEE